MPDNYGRMLLKDFVAPDGTVKLHHFTRAPLGDAFTTDPKMFGKNKWSQAEVKADSSPKTFFYVDPKDKESDTGPGGNHYTGSIPAEHLYDATEDPAYHAERAPNIRALLDKLKGLGYKGIYYSGVFPTVAIWHPVDVKREKTVEHPHQLSRPEGEKAPVTNRVLEDARAYHEANRDRLGLPEWSDEGSKATADMDNGRLAGAAFQNMEHAPKDPHVVAAYDALKREIKDQYDHLVSRGVKFEPWTKEGQPYANSKEMVADARGNRHLAYFPSKGGFGSDDRFNDHPLMEQVPGHPEGTVYNDLFRAVHDYFGHAIHGHQFGPTGELRAWVEHARMFSPLARKALTTETHGQNSWVNFGPHEPWKKPITERPYADQKAGILPEEAHPKVKLARVTAGGLAEAVGSEGSDNHKKRIELARKILHEAGVTPAQVKAVLVHADGGARPAVFATGNVANEQHARYAGAWMGLVTGSKRMTIFHPGEGTDVMHVFTTPMPVQQVSEYLNRAGLSGYSTDAHGAGTRVYVTDPDDRLDLQTLARGINARYHRVTGRADRIGSGTGSSATAGSGSGDPEARAAYRSVIRDAERAAGSATASAPTST